MSKAKLCTTFQSPVEFRSSLTASNPMKLLAISLMVFCMHSDLQNQGVSIRSFLLLKIMVLLVSTLLLLNWNELIKRLIAGAQGCTKLKQPLYKSNTSSNLRFWLVLRAFPIRKYICQGRWMRIHNYSVIWKNHNSENLPVHHAIKLRLRNVWNEDLMSMSFCTWLICKQMST